MAKLKEKSFEEGVIYLTIKDLTTCGQQHRGVFNFPRFFQPSDRFYSNNLVLFYTNHLLFLKSILLNKI